MDKANTIEYVFTPYITLKDGTRIYAKQYGKKAFCIPKTKEHKETKQSK